ncbi:Tim44/TimA family putative adaptor protein [Lichenifustis flavocetrariae]|uniref:Tim44/TimA family putative adaptor protein n=1 Tax=Lichenifustis flavocetrariae TaxID=2949735 RepID=A0AA42CP98_9HYPH|nr:Tim44/TimA family putative adaptor protein [Lichenifustis flavocetrariae]MCW6510190.1 Tim44/TimA family putative adaptor protein [Lichenifustis flavocetrariae]
MNQSFDVSTIVFAALAIFIVWKLRSVLGTRTGEERPPFNPFLRRGAPKQDEGAARETGTVIPMPGASAPTNLRPTNDPDRWKGVAEPGASLAASLDAIAAADPNFSGRGFIDGARMAYEMILDAFAKGDRAALSGLLAKDVYDGFVAAIADREARSETMEHTMVAVDQAIIVDAQLRSTVAHVGVRFESHQVNAIRTAGKALAEGSSEAVGQVVDHWTFTRTVTARDPNWTLASTSSE